MSDWHEDVLRHKYDPLPEEPPRYRKKSKKKRVRSDHKHVYENVVVDSPHAYVIRRDGRHKAWHRVTRCKVCGRIDNMWSHAYLDEYPEDMPLYRVDNFFELWLAKTLPEDRRVDQ